MRLDLDALRQELGRREARRVAIDGRGGAGKSTLARALACGWQGATVVEMDDFEVYRGAEADGRPDVARVLGAVLEPHAAGAPGRYRRYDWDAGLPAEPRQVPAGGVLILEGVYSACAALRRHLDYAIWVECPRALRLRRGVERDGEPMRATWVERWMPAEDAYFERERPDLAADLVIDGAAGDGAFEILRGP